MQKETYQDRSADRVSDAVVVGGGQARQSGTRNCAAMAWHLAFSGCGS